MRVLVCGSRKFFDVGFVFDALDAIHRTRGPITFLIHGFAQGADTCARDWAIEREVELRGFRALWTKPVPGAVWRKSAYGRNYNVMAGFQRNQRMLDEGKPDLCVAFKLTTMKNRGTMDMVERCRKAGVEVIIHTYRP